MITLTGGHAIKLQPMAPDAQGVTEAKKVKLEVPVEEPVEAPATNSVCPVCGTVATEGTNYCAICGEKL